MGVEEKEGNQVGGYCTNLDRRGYESRWGLRSSSGKEGQALVRTAGELADRTGHCGE